MDFLEFSRKRYSVRSYSDRPVEQDKIDKILQAAMIAPTAVNYQPQKIYVLKSQEALKKIRHITKSTYNAPLVFLVCADTERSWHSPFVEGYDSGEMDGSIVFAGKYQTALPASCWLSQRNGKALSTVA